MKNLLTKLKTLAALGMTMGLALGAKADLTPEEPKNVVDTLEDVVDRYDGKYSLREVVTDYAFAGDNGSNVVIGVSASDDPFQLSSDLILASNLTVSCANGATAGLCIKKQPGNLVIADGVSVTMNCALNAYAAKGSAITNCVVFGTNACVRMSQRFNISIGCYVKSTEDLFEKGEIKIFEPGETGPSKTAEDICKNTHAYDPDGKGYTTVVNSEVIYLKAPPPIKFEVSAPEGATAAVYKNAVDPANKVDEGGTIRSNSTAYVVYTVTNGKFFENGETVVTNTLGTTTDPAKDRSAYVPTKTGTPTVKLGVVAQRYPWNGMLDVNYKTPFYGASGVVTFKANGTVLGTAKGTAGQEATASFDLSTVAGGAFKDKKLKNVKISATIE